MAKAKIFKPKLIITDFDGCLTDDRVWLNEHGEEFVAANRKDGLGIKRVKKLGIEVIIASTEENKVVSARGKKHDLEVLQGLEDKKVALNKYLENPLIYAFSLKESDAQHGGATSFVSQKLTTGEKLSGGTYELMEDEKQILELIKITVLGSFSFYLRRCLDILARLCLNFQLK